VLSACLLANASLATRAIVLHPQVIMLVLLIVVLALASIGVLTMGLADTRALTVVPVWVATYIILDIMGGAVFFAELHNFTGLRIFFFIVGVVLIMGATVLQIALEDYSATPDAYEQQVDEEKAGLTDLGQ